MRRAFFLLVALAFSSAWTQSDPLPSWNDGPAKQASACIHVVAPDLQCQQTGLSRAAERTGLCDGKSDPDRLSVLVLRERRIRADEQHEGNCPDR